VEIARNSNVMVMVMMMMMMMLVLVVVVVLLLLLLLVVVVVVVVVMSGQTICFCEPTNPQVKHYRIKIRPPQPLSETNPKHSRFQTVKDEDKRA